MDWENRPDMVLREILPQVCSTSSAISSNSSLSSSLPPSFIALAVEAKILPNAHVSLCTRNSQLSEYLSSTLKSSSSNHSSVLPPMPLTSIKIAFHSLLMTMFFGFRSMCHTHLMHVF